MGLSDFLSQARAMRGEGGMVILQNGGEPAAFPGVDYSAEGKARWEREHCPHEEPVTVEAPRPAEPSILSSGGVVVTRCDLP